MEGWCSDIISGGEGSQSSSHVTRLFRNFRYYNTILVQNVIHTTGSYLYQRERRGNCSCNIHARAGR